ncbi:MAG: BPL-N domain-containing protein [Syntrophobacteraceae bacterium]
MDPRKPAHPSLPGNHSLPGSDQDGTPVGLLWTHSLVWGLLCMDALSLLGIPCRLLSAADICQGRLEAERLRILIVPGGWADHKVRALGEEGRAKIARFIDAGGSYVGFCGGAGLALSSPPALNLVPIRRMDLSRRLPSASGRVYVCGTPAHAAWEDIPEQIPLSIWWPSQFLMPSGCEALCLASYTNRPGEDFQVADIRVSDIDGSVSWGELEKLYGINLDPARLQGQPALIEARRGKGSLILSYAHLETPGDFWGNRLFFNILKYLDDSLACADPDRQNTADRLLSGAGQRANAGLPSSPIVKARQAAADLIAFGEANLLWNWRKPWLLYWRRGVRGFEYGSLFVTLCCLAELETKSGSVEGGAELEQRTLEFCELARQLLFEEKMATGTGALSKLGRVNDKIDSLRALLFGAKMNHAGLCSRLFEHIDRMLLAGFNRSAAI